MGTAPSPRATFPDEHVARLARLFAEHPAWIAAARHVSNGATSAVYFRHRPGEAWHLERRSGHTELRRGPARDPDLAFRFTPPAIERLASVEGDVGDFAVALFDLMAQDDDAVRVGFRVVAPFLRLVRRGYVRLLLAAGPKVVAYGARRGVHGIGELRRIVRSSQAAGPEPWETP